MCLWGHSESSSVALNKYKLWSKPPAGLSKFLIASNEIVLHETSTDILSISVQKYTMAIGSLTHQIGDGQTLSVGPLPVEVGLCQSDKRGLESTSPSDEKLQANSRSENYIYGEWMIERFRDPLKRRTSDIGVAFKNLSVYGYSIITDYQRTVANYPLVYYHLLFGRQRKSRVYILRDFEGVIRSGELILVLGKPGSGCTTFLKMLAGRTHGFLVDSNSQMNYQGTYGIMQRANCSVFKRLIEVRCHQGSHTSRAQRRMQLSSRIRSAYKELDHFSDTCNSCWSKNTRKRCWQIEPQRIRCRYKSCYRSSSWALWSIRHPYSEHQWRRKAEDHFGRSPHFWHITSMLGQQHQRLG